MADCWLCGRTGPRAKEAAWLEAGKEEPGLSLDSSGVTLTLAP